MPLFVSRSTRAVDTTGPSAPTISASATTTSTITITRTSSSSDASGISYYETQRSAAGAGAWTTFDTSSTNPLTAAGLNPATSYDFRQRAVDTLGNLGTYSATATATTATGSDGNDGLVVSNYAAYDPDAASIISLDINNTIPNWGSNGGASMSFANESWWNGTAPVCTLRPPTINDQNSGFGAIPFWKNGTKIVRQLNVRWEWHCSPIFCQNVRNYPKFIILRAYPELNGSTSTTPTRPMLQMENFIESGTAIDLQDTVAMSITQDTFRMFSSTNITPAPTRAQDNGSDPTTAPATRQPVYFSATAGVDGAGNPILATTEIVTIEMRINVMPTSDEPNGVNAFRISRRNGQVFERACAWTWAPSKTVGTHYIADLDSMGGGYYNNANANDPNLWTKMGRRLTLGFNLQPTVGRYWMGPAQGFVL